MKTTYFISFLGNSKLANIPLANTEKIKAEIKKSNAENLLMDFIKTIKKESKIKLTGATFFENKKMLAEWKV